MDQIGRSLQFCHLEFDEKPISYCFMAQFSVFSGGGGFQVLRKLGYCGPFEPCFYQCLELNDKLLHFVQNIMRPTFINTIFIFLLFIFRFLTNNIYFVDIYRDNEG